MLTEADCIEIILTNSEMRMGAECGVMRNIAAMKDGREPAYGFDEEHAWNIHIEGACGEVAAAKCLGRFWSPTINTFSAPDIGLKIQVRTRSKHIYELPIRPKDVKESGDHAFVLVTGCAPRFMVRGYRIARDVTQREDWKQTHGGRPMAWFVPQVELWPVRDLILREQNA